MANVKVVNGNKFEIRILHVGFNAYRYSVRRNHVNRLFTEVNKEQLRMLLQIDKRTDW